MIGLVIIVESISISEADSILQRENPLQHDYSPFLPAGSSTNVEKTARVGKHAHLIGDAEKVFVADRVVRADIVIRLTKVRVD